MGMFSPDECGWAHPDEAALMQAVCEQAFELRNRMRLGLQKLVEDTSVEVPVQDLFAALDELAAWRARPSNACVSVAPAGAT